MVKTAPFAAAYKSARLCAFAEYTRRILEPCPRCNAIEIHGVHRCANSNAYLFLLSSLSFSQRAISLSLSLSLFVHRFPRVVKAISARSRDWTLSINISVKDTEGSSRRWSARGNLIYNLGRDIRIFINIFTSFIFANLYDNIGDFWKFYLYSCLRNRGNLFGI